MKSRKGGKPDDVAEGEGQGDAESAAAYLAGDVMEQYAREASDTGTLDRRGLLKRGAILAGLAGLGVGELHAQGKGKGQEGKNQDAKNQPQGPKGKTMKRRGPPTWSLWWMKFRFKKGNVGAKWVTQTPADACTPSCIFTPAAPCTALCQTPGDVCTQSCIMTPEPPPADPLAAVSPSDPCTPNCVTEGTLETCTPGCVTEGTMETCTPGCIA